MVELIDEAGNLVMNEYADGIDLAKPVSVACPSNFATTQTVYLATFSSGVKKLDLSQPAPTWVAVGVSDPDLWLSNMSLAPNFDQDPTVIIGSQDGLIYCKDEPGESWQFNMPPTWRWDVTDTFSMRESSGMEFVDNTVHSTTNDGSYFNCMEYAGGLKLHTFRGPECGSITITVEDYWTGDAVGTKTVDLNATVWKNREVTMTFPFRPVRISVVADLDAGEVFHFDGMTFGPR